jgi:alpha-galactosidase
MTEVCPDATMLNYVNPMAMNTWAMYARYPHIKQVGLCHSVQGTAEELARDLDLDPADLRYRCAGINHMAFYLSLEKNADGSYVSIYPDLLQAYAEGGRRSTCTATRAAKTSSAMRCSKSWATS